jgi:hydroxyquinol 1,2-dioxygenase
VSAPGYATLITHLFDAASGYLDSDAVFGVRDSLVVPFAADGDTGSCWPASTSRSNLRA